MNINKIIAENNINYLKEHVLAGFTREEAMQILLTLKLEQVKKENTLLQEKINSIKKQ
jgi:hypothetical protein